MKTSISWTTESGFAVSTTSIEIDFDDSVPPLSIAVNLIVWVPVLRLSADTSIISPIPKSTILVRLPCQRVFWKISILWIHYTSRKDNRTAFFKPRRFLLDLLLKPLVADLAP